MAKNENHSIGSIYKRRLSDRDIFQELMPHKVKEVLLFATLYDSFSIEREGQFSDKIFGEYLQLNLYAAPRFTSVNTLEHLSNIIHTRHFDLVIIMAGADIFLPLEVARIVYNAKPRIPILLLLNSDRDVRPFQLAIQGSPAIDRIFVWNANSNVFLAMIKYIEDKKNVANDTRMGGVRVILLVEDSIKYYSRYLPLLFTSVMMQTQALVSDKSEDELHKIFKYRARPKVLLVSSYEEALVIIHEYKEKLLCVISDVQFPRNGVDDTNAGIELLNYVRQTLRYPIPLLLQSHDSSNAIKAADIQAGFITKNSYTLANDINEFINKNLGFGDFVFRNAKGDPIGGAKNLEEFESYLKIVPEESLVYHGSKNDFSSWMMARGEIKIAERLIPFKIENFQDPSRIREVCLAIFRDVKEKKNRGRVIRFDPELIYGNRWLLLMGNGSLGGKGRGLAFISHLIANIDMKVLLPGINIRMPATVIIGASEFDRFIQHNNLYEFAYHKSDFEELRVEFLHGELSPSLCENLSQYINLVTQPLAVRSSGLFEDSLVHPCSGVYATYLIPNNHAEASVRLEQLTTAIKLVFASVFSDQAKAFFGSLNYKIEEEKMAIVIQPVVGQEREGRFYADISGMAQSFNYYPYGYLKPDDGLAVMSIGLGQTVMSGEKAFRFCPKYPELKMGMADDQIRDSQRECYGIDMRLGKSEVRLGDELSFLRKYQLSELEKDRVFDSCASTYHADNDILVPGYEKGKTMVVDYAAILEYKKFPLCVTLDLLLDLFKQAMGSPVEMEFAIDLSQTENGWPTFFLLQLKPLIRNSEDSEVDLSAKETDKLLMRSAKGMGNGLIAELVDVVYVSSFDKFKTKEIAAEIATLNRLMVSQNKQYVLIGPGRWGTRDNFTGIPVNWSEISNARVIVELAIPGFAPEPSLGSHFFHNVTSMNIGYFAIQANNESDFFRLDLLEKQTVCWEGKYVKHISFCEPFEVLMDGRQQAAIIRVQ